MILRFGIRAISHLVPDLSRSATALVGIVRRTYQLHPHIRVVKRLLPKLCIAARRCRGAFARISCWPLRPPWDDDLRCEPAKFRAICPFLILHTPACLLSPAGVLRPDHFWDFRSASDEVCDAYGGPVAHLRGGARRACKRAVPAREEVMNCSIICHARPKELQPVWHLPRWPRSLR